jgi:hypothetical protein
MPMQTMRAMSKLASRPSEKRFYNYLLFAEYEQMLHDEQYLPCYRELRHYTYINTTTANSMCNTTTKNHCCLYSYVILKLLHYTTLNRVRQEEIRRSARPALRRAKSEPRSWKPAWYILMEGELNAVQEC